MLTNIVHRWDDIMKLKGGEMIWPHFVDFHSTNICNQHCTGCAYDSLLQTQIMPEFRQFEAIDTFLDVGVKAFDFAGGGEPTLAPYLARAMKYIADRGAHFALITNGVKMSDELMDVLVSHGTYLRVSLEASDPETYKAYKKTPDWHWNKVLSNIREMVRLKNDRGSQLEISLKFLVGKPIRGVRHYNQIMELADSLGVDRVNIKAIVHPPDELPEPEKDEENENLLNVLAMNDHIAKKTHHQLVKRYTAETHPQCWLTPVHSMVEWNGDVFLCCYHYYRKDEMILGNMWERPFKEIWMDKHHRDKINGIDKAGCSLVQCKFAGHTEAVNEAMMRGSIGWI